MKLAAVSSKSIVSNVLQNLSSTINWIERLDQQGVGFILFPELNLSGYTKNIEILNEVLAQKDSVFEELISTSKQTETAFAVGFPEQANGKYYISHFLFHKGQFVGKHRKTHLGPSEKATFSEGNELDVFNIDGIKIGIQLCFETHFPEISFIQAKQGANVLAMAFASPREDAATKLERFKRFLPTRAYDNACFVVACNLQQGYHSNTQKSEMIFPRLSLITNPKGIVLQEAVSEKTDVAISQIDLGQVKGIKQSRMGWFNKSKRINLFQKYYAGKETQEGKIQ